MTPEPKNRTAHAEANTAMLIASRANHTGNQAIATVTGLQTELDGKAAGY